MKKIGINSPNGGSNTALMKGLFIMKIVLFLILTSTFHLLATGTYSQTTRLSLSLNQTPIKQILKEIERSSEFHFLYNNELIDVERKVDIQVENELVNSILDMLFDSKVTKYAIYNKQIVISPAGMPLPQEALRKVSGKVTDQIGAGIPGATVAVKGASIGIITDSEGRFNLSIPADAKILVFSFVGMNGQEIAIENKKIFNVVLSEANTQLDEVVAIGYGTMKKKDVTGSVGSVDTKQLKEINVTRADQALVGKIAGVQISQSSGGPGDAPLVRIRGIGSISAGAGPLYVVDGVPGGSIDALTPSDIESMDVLKDASASAIYGSRGANGVIIVNTKRGKLGEAKISFDSHYGWQQISRRPEFLTGKEQAQYAYYAIRNSNLDAGNDVSGDPSKWKFPLPQPFNDVLNGTNTVNNDLLDHIFRTAPEKEFQVTASGGSENFKYSVSLDHLDQDGIILNSYFKRYSVRANFDAKLSKRLDLQFNLNPSHTVRNIVPSAGTGAGNAEQTTSQATAWITFFPAYKDNGDYNLIDQAVSMTLWHPVAVAKEITNLQKDTRLLGNIKITYKITDDLKFNVLGGVNLSNMGRMKFTPQLAAFVNNVATGSQFSTEGINWITEYTLDYNHTFGLHSFSGLAGFTAQHDWQQSSSFTSNKYPNNLVPTLNAVSGIITGGTSNINEWSMLSYLARINYNYKSKYYATASYRTDGSSRFGSLKKWGVFPSFALSWRVSQENFLKNVSFLNELKLRASYGRTGNNNIGNYAHLATINYEKYPLGGAQNGGYSQAIIANPSLTWESQSQTNGGLDVRLFDRRLSFSVDYFHSINSDLLLDVNIPSTSGFNSTLRNIGKVQNTGWEFTVSTVNLKGKFEWTTDFNFSAYRNKVLKLGPSGDPIYVGGNVTMIGQPIGMFYGWVTNGIFMNQSELDKGPIFGAGTKNASRMGDVRFVDVSGPTGVPDGKIDSYDKTIMGNPYPDFYYGMNNHFSYKNFTLNISLQGSYGNDILSEARVGATNGRGTRLRMYSIMRDYWISPEKPGAGTSNSFRPNDTPTGNNRGSWNDRYVDTGTFMRINNMTLGYLLPSKIVSKLTLSSLRIYVSSNNPFTFSKNTSFNPEVSARSNNLQPGNDLNDYPIPKSVMIGVNVVF